MTTLILGVNAIVNCQLSQQAIRWPVSRDYIPGSGLELIEVVCKLIELFIAVFKFPHSLTI